MMKICFVADIGSIHTQRWVNYFTSKNYEIHVISKNALNISGAHSYKLNSFKNKLISDMGAIYETKALIKKINPDIIHGHYITDYGFLASLMNYHPLIVSVWGSDILIDANKNHFWKYCVKSILNKSDAITCTSNCLYHATIPFVKNTNKINIIPFGVDLEIFSPINYKKNISNLFTIGFVKNFSDICGIEYLIQSIPKIYQKFQNIKIIVAGKGNYANFRKLACALEIDHIIEFVGEVEHKLIPNFLNTIDVLVIPSLSESFGVIALEAQAMEIPVVASNIGGLPEVIIDGKTGFLIEPKNPSLISEKIIELIDNVQFKREMGKNGRDFIIKNYNWYKNAQLMEDLYNKLLGK